MEGCARVIHEAPVDSPLALLISILVIQLILPATAQHIYELLGALQRLLRLLLGLVPCSAGRIHDVVCRALHLTSTTSFSRAAIHRRSADRQTVLRTA